MSNDKNVDKKMLFLVLYWQVAKFFEHFWHHFFTLQAADYQAR